VRGRGRPGRTKSRYRQWVNRSISSNLANSPRRIVWSGCVVAAPVPWVLRLKEYEFTSTTTRCPNIFGGCSRVYREFLYGREAENARLAAPFADKGWIGRFMDCSASAASKFARHLKSAEFVSYSWIFGEFSEAPGRISLRTGRATSSRLLLGGDLSHGDGFAGNPKALPIPQGSTQPTSRSFAVCRSSPLRFGLR